MIITKSNGVENELSCTLIIIAEFRCDEIQQELVERLSIRAGWMDQWVDFSFL